MCFSAAGSFALSGVLAGVGTASLARSASTPYRMFAAIPFVFAAQQASEGLVWLTVADSAHSALHATSVMLFLGIALVAWPVWLPWSLRLVERDPSRRRLLMALFWVGVVASASASFLLARWQPAARIAGHSVTYDFGVPTGNALHFVMLVAYILPTAAPFFVSTTQLAKTIGATLVVSLALAVAVERDGLTSVWCFFAAILSMQVLAAVGRERRSGAAAIPRTTQTNHG